MQSTYLSAFRVLINPAHLLALSCKSILIYLVLVACMLPQQLLAQGIANSVIFSSADSSSLSRTPATAGNRKTWTWSGWVKRGNLATSQFQHIFASDSGSDPDRVYWGRSDVSPDALGVSFSDTYHLVTTAVYRDPAKWMHITLAVDTTQAIASDRMKLFVDGVQLTEFTSNTYPPQNYDTQINHTQAHYLGSRISSDYLDGYLSDVHFIDGQALDPSHFGEADVTSGKWIPKSYTGSYGTNGFKLDFAAGADLGNDVSGNNNDWTANNLDATDQVIDTPTNNFAGLNILDKVGDITLSNGGLNYSNVASSQIRGNMGFGVSGKWYCEFTAGNAASPTNPQAWGISTVDGPITNNGTALRKAVYSYVNTSTVNAVYYYLDGVRQSPSGNQGLGITSVSSGDIMQLAYDADTGNIWLGVNDQWSDGAGGVTGNPSTGVSPTVTIPTGDNMTVFLSNSGAAYSGSLNCGQNARSGLTYNTDAGGYFKYTPPAGFRALSSNNLPATYRQYDDSVLYIDGDGVDASTSFTDEAKHRHSITVNGDAQVDTAQSKFGGGSMSFDGNGDYLSITDSDDWDIVGDFTIDFWALKDANGAKGYDVVCTSGTGGSYYDGWMVELSSSRGFSFGHQTNGNERVTHNINPNDSTWHHWAVSREGDTVRLFRDGVLLTSGAVSTETIPGIRLNIGYDNVYSFKGHIDDLRITKGRALWTSGFTPPASAHVTYTEKNIIANPRNYFDVVTYTGNGATQDITGLNFQPDLVWIKERTNTSAHTLTDSVRGLGKSINSDSTNTETTSAVQITAFNDDGFSLGASNGINQSSEKYVAWCWKEEPTAGFDIVSYTGDGSSGRVLQHDLGAAPELMLIKGLNNSDHWFTYHAGNLNPADNYLYLNGTSAVISGGASPWNATAPTSSTITLGSDGGVNGNGNNYIAYLFASKPGFSEIGSYTGNGSADGPFVYTGFKPAFVMFKRTDDTNNWEILDSTRNPSNPKDARLYPNLSNVEGTTEIMDFLSNGFKLRVAGSVNADGGDYIFIAFAETSLGASPDETPPQLTEIYTVPAVTADTTPAYSFYTDEAGTIQLGGSCSSDTTTAVEGDNTITLSLAAGTYNDCTITVTDASGNVSDPLAISAFTIDPNYQYGIGKAVVFDSSNGEYLSWLPSKDGNPTTWSWSAWVQRGEIGGVKTLLHVDGGSKAAYIRFNHVNELEIALGDGSFHNYQSDAFSNSSEWMHLALSVDTTQANAVDRIRLHVNGQIISPKKGYIDPQQNAVTLINSANTHYLGSGVSTDYYDGTLAEVRLVDGVALDANAFGKVTAQGQWVPIEYSSGGGSNSSYLSFGDNADLGVDSAGNNNWQVVRLDSNSQTTPTTNTTPYGFTYADADEISVTTTITEVMSYATDNAYSVDECVLYVSDQFTTICPSNSSFVIKQDTNIGRLMCSVGLAAFTSNREVKISSDNDICSPNQGAPYAKLISIVK